MGIVEDLKNKWEWRPRFNRESGKWSPRQRWWVSRHIWLPWWRWVIQHDYYEGFVFAQGAVDQNIDNQHNNTATYNNLEAAQDSIDITGMEDNLKELVGKFTRVEDYDNSSEDDDAKESHANDTYNRTTHIKINCLKQPKTKRQRVNTRAWRAWESTT